MSFCRGREGERLCAERQAGGKEKGSAQRNSLAGWREEGRKGAAEAVVGRSGSEVWDVVGIDGSQMGLGRIALRQEERL